MLWISSKNIAAGPALLLPKCDFDKKVKYIKMIKRITTQDWEHAIRVHITCNYYNVAR